MLLARRAGANRRRQSARLWLARLSRQSNTSTHRRREMASAGAGRKCRLKHVPPARQRPGRSPGWCEFAGARGQLQYAGDASVSVPRLMLILPSDVQRSRVLIFLAAGAGMAANPDRRMSKATEACLRLVLAELREQHELAKCLDHGSLRHATITLLECSLATFRLVSGSRRYLP
jgi:hypothetical protein